MTTTAARAGPPPGRTVRRTTALSDAGRARLVPPACGVVMLLVGLWGLDRGSMWQDEAATYEVARRSVGQILGMLDNVDVVHGLYYLFMHVWLRPGGGEVWMRVPSVLAMAVAAGAVAALGVRLGGRAVGLVAGLLLAAVPLASFYAQEARSTALVTGLVLVATVLLVDAAGGRADGGADRRSRGRGALLWTGYGVAMALAVVLHEFAVLALAAQSVMLLLNRVRVATWLRWLAVAVVCAALVIPLAIASQAQSGQVAWLTRPDGRTLVELFEQLVGSNAVLVAITVPLVVVALVSDARRRGGRGWTVSSVALPLLLVPLVVLLGASLVVQPLFDIRYVLFVVAGVPLLTARGLVVVARAVGRAVGRPYAAPAVGVLVAAALVAAQVPQLVAVRSVDSRTDDLAGAARVVAAHSRPGDAVLFLPLRYRAAAQAYPADFAHVHDVALATSGVQADNLRGIDKSRRQVRRAMLAQHRIWVVGRTGLVVRPWEKGAVSALAVLRADFTRTAAWTVHGMTVGLYERDPTP